MRTRIWNTCWCSADAINNFSFLNLKKKSRRLNVVVQQKKFSNLNNHVSNESDVKNCGTLLTPDNFFFFAFFVLFNAHGFYTFTLDRRKKMFAA